ncbi:uncharacterized protein PV09_01162 [Verruconis gallopava]|uniref:Uncharacterized protein n=1 Tax=Verruconis gallopava TaxID=253628 RepID=A0A0D2BA94_9PEZI|nr:uncharacterized protein PV09_01162 [Verruconis gallopava]KIW08234.1 hypothetical protein PV09_01162 [Verruconis gallopava]
MARLMVRSKSHQKLREPAVESRVDSMPSSEQVSSETSSLHPGSSSPLVGVARSRYASPASTPGFEVLSRPKTANAAMDEQRRRRLMAMGDPISVTDGKQTFNFPTPLREGPSPRLMSRYANSSLAPRPNLERSDTPDTIGIALGSPSHLAQFESRWSPSPVHEKSYFPSNGATPVGTPGLREAREQRADASQSKPKLSRWKSIFGRKNQPRDQREARQQDDHLSPEAPPKSGPGLNNYHTWEHASPRSPRMRSDTVPRYDAPPQASSPRLGIGRSQTAPTGRRNPNSPQVPPKDFLDVEIPNTTLERYSVMFNGILPKQPGGLLARRQSKRESRITGQHPQTLQDLDIPPVPKRRNTNASPNASPSYRLLIFPPESTNSPKPLERNTSLLHRPRPLKRSNTAPGALSPGLHNKMDQLSPMSETSEALGTETDLASNTDSAPPTSDLPGEDELKRIEDELDRVEQELRRDERNRQALTPTPSEPSSPATPEDGKSVQSYNPFAVDAAHTRKSSSNSWEDRSMQEPDWEMITIGKVAEPGDRFSGAQTVRVVEEPSPIDKAAPSPPQVWHPLRMNSLVDKDRAKLNGGRPKHPLTATMTSQPLPGKVEVQVARSMSVTKGAKARPVLRTSPRGVEKGKGETLVERKPLTPQLVEPASSGDSFTKGHKPMKSVAASIVEMA